MTNLARAILFMIITVALPSVASAQETGFAETVNAVMQPVSDVISAIIFFAIPLGEGVELPIILVWLLGFSIFFTIRMGFINFRGIKQSIKIVSGKYDDENDPGEVTHFQALTAAVSGTVGLGNIAGVAIAVSVGGAGATFWMILAGLFGMSSKFAECTLGLKYREISPEGKVSGGPMRYLTKGLAEQGRPQLGKIMGTLFAILCIGGAFGAGAIFQVNQSASQFTSQIVEYTGGDTSFFLGKGWIFGIIFALALGLVIIGGIKSIANVTSKLVPLMAAIYVISALIIIFTNVSEIPAAFGQIIAGAFSSEGIQGGFIGVMIQGLRRASFSNEAGLGSAAIAHSAAKTREPISEGLVALLEPFIDTVVICTITALVIIITGSMDASQSGTAAGISLTSKAFGTLGSVFPIILTIAVILFAFSTSLTWFYYGERSFIFLVGENKSADLTFKIVYLGALVVGSAMTLGPVVDIADGLLFAMSIPNLIGVFMMHGQVRDMLKDYLARVRSGEIREVNKT